MQADGDWARRLQRSLAESAAAHDIDVHFHTCVYTMIRIYSQPRGRNSQAKLASRISGNAADGGGHGGSCRYRRRSQRNADGLRIVAEMLRPEDRLTVVSQGPVYPFRPLQSMGRGRLAQARGYRGRSCRCHEPKRDPPADAGRASACSPQKTAIDLDGRHVDRLRLPGRRDRTGARLRRDPGPRARTANTQSICHVDHAADARQGLREALPPIRGPS